MVLDLLVSYLTAHPAGIEPSIFFAISVHLNIHAYPSLSMLALVSYLRSSVKRTLHWHYTETSHNIAWGDSRIITTNNRYGQRLCLEAWHINVSPCALNRDDGSYLPEEYLHLVGR